MTSLRNGHLVFMFSDDRFPFCIVHFTLTALLDDQPDIHNNSQPASVLILLVLFSARLFFFRLGATGLFDADEPAYAQAAREMLRTAATG